MYCSHLNFSPLSVAALTEFYSFNFGLLENYNLLLLGGVDIIGPWAENIRSFLVQGILPSLAFNFFYLIPHTFSLYGQLFSSPLGNHSNVFDIGFLLFSCKTLLCPCVLNIYKWHYLIDSIVYYFHETIFKT